MNNMEQMFQSFLSQQNSGYGTPPSPYTNTFPSYQGMIPPSAPREDIFETLFKAMDETLTVESRNTIMSFFMPYLFRAGGDRNKAFRTFGKDFTDFIKTSKGKEWAQLTVDAFFGAMHSKDQT